MSQVSQKRARAALGRCSLPSPQSLMALQQQQGGQAEGRSSCVNARLALKVNGLHISGPEQEKGRRPQNCLDRTVHRTELDRLYDGKIVKCGKRPNFGTKSYFTVPYRTTVLAHP